MSKAILKPAFTIRQFGAFWLLLVFTISIAPKTFFHEWLAGHTDTTSCTQQHTSKACMQQQGFHCGFDELVVTTPFVVADAPVLVIEKVLQPHTTAAVYPSLLSSAVLYTVSRGPPSA